jgi:hypothetical protein
MHRIIGRDGYRECFACGTVVEIVPDGDTDGAFRYIPCKPGGWDHPPYVYGNTPDAVFDGPVFETCAAHPYETCEGEARKVWLVGRAIADSNAGVTP